MMCKKDRNRIVSWIVMGGLFVFFCAILISARSRFHSSAMVLQNLDPNCVEMEYSSSNQRLVITRTNGTEFEFKVTEGGSDEVVNRIRREKKKYGEWEFKFLLTPAESGYGLYSSWVGNRK